MNPKEDSIRILISVAIRRSKKGWKQVAELLSVEVDATITASMLHECTRSRRVRETEHKGTKKLFPMDWVPALAKITSSHELEQYALCDECRHDLAVGKLGTAAMRQKSK